MNRDLPWLVGCIALVALLSGAPLLASDLQVASITPRPALDLHHLKLRPEEGVTVDGVGLGMQRWQVYELLGRPSNVRRLSKDCVMETYTPDRMVGIDAEGRVGFVVGRNLVVDGQHVDVPQTPEKCGLFFNTLRQRHRNLSVTLDLEFDVFHVSRNPAGPNYTVCGPVDGSVRLGDPPLPNRASRAQSLYP